MRLEKLDAALTRRIKPPVLSAEFNQRLRQRLQTEAQVVPATERAERKRQLQAEFDAGLAQLNRRSLTVSGILDTIGYVLLGGLAGLLVWQLAIPVRNAMSEAVGAGLLENLLLSILAAAVFVCVGIAVTFWRQSTTLWRAA